MRALISCGVLPLLSSLTLVFAEEQPAAPKPAVSASVASDDLLQAPSPKRVVEAGTIGQDRGLSADDTRIIARPKVAKPDSIGQDRGITTPILTSDQQVAELVEAYRALPAAAKLEAEGDRIIEGLH